MKAPHLIPDSPDFKKLLSEGKIASGADLNEAMHVWNTEEQLGPDDEVVQPKSRPNDLSQDELKGIQQRFEQDIAKDGPGQERALNRSNAEGRSDAEG